VCEVSGDCNGAGREGEGEVDGLGAVAAVGLALAYQSVVLFEDGLGKGKQLFSIHNDVNKMRFQNSRNF